MAHQHSILFKTSYTILQLSEEDHVYCSQMFGCLDRKVFWSLINFYEVFYSGEVGFHPGWPTSPLQGSIQPLPSMFLERNQRT